MRRGSSNFNLNGSSDQDRQRSLPLLTGNTTRQSFTFNSRGAFQNAAQGEQNVVGLNSPLPLPQPQCEGGSSTANGGLQSSIGGGHPCLNPPVPLGQQLREGDGRLDSDCIGRPLTNANARRSSFSGTDTQEEDTDMEVSLSFSFEKNGSGL
jgi:hypothetical protein